MTQNKQTMSRVSTRAGERRIRETMNAGRIGRERVLRPVLPSVKEVLTSLIVEKNDRTASPLEEWKPTK